MHVKTHMNLDNIMLSEKKPITKKKKHHILHDSVFTKCCQNCVYIKNQ